MDKEKKTITIKKTDLWKYSTFVLLAILIIFIFMSFSGFWITGKAVSQKKIGEEVVSFLNEQTGGGVSYVSSKSDGLLYEIIVLYESQKIPVYVTKDGKFLVWGKESLTESAVNDTKTQQSSQQGYSSEDLDKISDFVSCLKDKGVKIYGASWCGWTQKLVVETFGGLAMVSSIYVECTEQTELCTQEQISGYPTIKINGQTYSGDRSLKDLAEKTGCTAPEITGSQTTNSNTSASC